MKRYKIAGILLIVVGALCGTGRGTHCLVCGACLLLMHIAELLESETGAGQ